MIAVETEIAAPVERCFLLSLSVDLHVRSAAQTAERAVAGVTHGLIGPGERVTWRGRHFGIVLTHESLITRYERPSSFQDSMVRGAFQTFVHDHFFSGTASGATILRDELRFSAPLGVLGRLAETLLLDRYLSRFLRDRNRVIKEVAESPAAVWEKFIGADF